jgi:hypothetical protein
MVAESRLTLTLALAEQPAETRAKAATTTSKSEVFMVELLEILFLLRISFPVRRPRVFNQRKMSNSTYRGVGSA